MAAPPVVGKVGRSKVAALVVGEEAREVKVMVMARREEAATVLCKSRSALHIASSKRMTTLHPPGCSTLGTRCPWVEVGGGVICSVAVAEEAT